MKLKPYEMIRATLTCPACNKKAVAALMVNQQGMIKVTQYLCCDDFSVMLLEIPDGNSEQSGSDETVG